VRDNARTRAQDENNLRDALKHSAAMLGELRTSLLSPQKYYALYMKTFDELRHLEAFFTEENKRGRSNAELYEIVQHAGNILPRMCARRCRAPTLRTHA
jgi:vacuolar protein sorting-associated protein 35